VDGTIYLGDSQAFSAAGKVLRYTATGQKIDELTAGIGPNNFYFFKP
jgi:hypothetical protein